MCMTNQQGALQYADRDHTDLGSYYMRHVSAMTGEALHSKSAIAAELAHRDREIDRLQAENANLNAGYAAARLEIESLQARIKTMAEEHADELMVAHLDGRMRAEQPAGAQQPGEAYAALSDAEIDRIVPALEPVSEDFPVEWALWKDRGRIRNELRASHGQAPAQAAPAAVAGPSEFPHEQMDALALARYKVVPSHESMFHRHAVVAGDGSQQLYIGREVECQNIARKFAGAFLDGAFAFHSMLAAAPTPPAQTADSVLEDAARLERERICAAIKAEDDYCVEQGDYMLDSDDCIKIVRGEWVRPDFSVDAARKHDEALIRQLVAALSLPCDRWNGTQSRIVREAIDAGRAWLEGKA